MGGGQHVYIYLLFIPGEGNLEQLQLRGQSAVGFSSMLSCVIPSTWGPLWAKRHAMVGASVQNFERMAESFDTRADQAGDSQLWPFTCSSFNENCCYRDGRSLQ